MRRTRAMRDTTGGFLLTETLATFAISAVVLVGLVSTSSVLLRAIDHSVIDAQGTDDLDRSLAAIKRDLSGLTRARFDGVEPQPFVFRGGPNSIFFARRDLDSAGFRVTRVVAIREIVAGSTKRLTLSDARLPATATSFADLHYGAPRDLATGHARLRFSYVGRQSPQGIRALPTTSWTNGGSLPSAVLIDALDTVTGRLIVSIRVPIRVDGDIGCIGTNRAQPGPSPDATPNLVSSTLPGKTSSPTALATAYEPAPIGPPPDDDFCAGPSFAESRP